MLKYILRRILILIPMLILLSIISFSIIQLPPGSYLDTYVTNLQAQGLTVDQAEIDRLTRQYGLDQPLYIQYFRWMRNFLLRGDLGRSFIENRPVTEILQERVPPTMIISLVSIFFVWVVAIPIGVYSATHQYSFLDYVFTFLGFIGVSVPSFLFALILMWLVFSNTGYAISGLNSVEFMDAPWRLPRILDMLKNIWLPLVVLAMGGTAGLIRTIRANLLDELGKQYVTTARSKGLRERKLLWKYPIRIAFNPVFSTIGWMLPAIVGGESLVAIILNLRTVGPILLSAVRSQDMYLAGGIVMILSALTLIGTLISDLALAWLDPRIRYQ
jgi:peptide/nickel transport system permease protein